ncbi:sialic acid-binding Ig-like lectin 14 isoform X2 [Marmota marmota marmota]|uniref:sialic acid-binding Ig-like lectin 14 isoform X2 n=1 Tax=Marmota marmota marmota TaxID=9994 RepID=UPI002092D1E6|nr:sialic acid-binding Ig-like lectin 14 isoform X2 [Marmota marmota marmota]
MLPLLLLPLLWAGSLQEDAGYKLQLQESVTVQAGLCALVPCSFSYPWSGWSPPSKLYIYWIREGDRTYYDGPVATNNPDMDVRTEHRNRFHLPGDVRDNNCSLLIRDAKKKDTGSYVLMADIGWNTRYAFRDKKLTLQVTALTEKPVIHSLEPLESGRPTSLSCRLPGSCEGGRPLQFSWTGAVTSSMAPGALQSSVLSLTPRPQDHDTNLTCQVKLQGSAVTTESTVQLNVSYAPQNLSIRILFGNGTDPPRLLGPSCSWEAQALLCSCSSRAWPAPSLHWRLGEGLLEGNSSNASLRVTSSSEGPWANSSLSLHGALSSDLRLSCEAQNAQGTQSATVLLLPGRSRPGVLLAALGGAGAGALLSLCLCLVFFCIVKSCRKHGPGKPEVMDDRDPVMDTVPWGPRQKSCPDSSGDQACPAGGAVPPGKQEMHYATLSFHGTSSAMPRGREATSSTDYSEIRTSK